jgi:hypothetical protein
MREKLFGQQNTLPEFLKSGISLDLRDQKNGRTLLMSECCNQRGESARQEEDNAKRVYNLIFFCHDARTNPRLQDHDGETVSTLAAKNIRVEMLRFLALLKDGTLRNSKGESPLSLLLGELFSPNFQGSPRKPNLYHLDDCLSRLIDAHDFAGMTEEKGESFEHILSTLRKFIVDSPLHSDRDDGGIMYLNALARFAEKNNQYQKNRIEQLAEELSLAAHKEMGREDVAAILKQRPSQARDSLNPE